MIRTIPVTYKKTKNISADLLVILFLFATLYSLFLFMHEAKSDYNPSFEVDLSFTALPLYALFSAMRGIIAYFFSFFFTLVVGYWAAKSKSAEKIIIPALDILQSIPVLGFLPGLVLGLVAIFPNSNLGLELAAILMIFTGQVWNMTFAFYSSLKSIPTDLIEATTIMSLSKFRRLIKLELPFSAVNLVWNSIMSMAGGWFFLTVCEAFVLGDKEYRLPGIGSYIAKAISESNTPAIIAAVLAMSLIVVIFDFLLWRPALSYVHKFRLENTNMNPTEDRILSFIFNTSYIIKLFRHFKIIKNRYRYLKKITKVSWPSITLPKVPWSMLFTIIKWPILILLISLLLWGTAKLFHILIQVSFETWLTIIKGIFLTFLRVLFAVSLATLWTLPAGIWITRNTTRLKIAQPISQLLASFPAPMLYPLVLAVTFKIGLSFEFSSMLLIFLGVQWYVLFNTLAGGLRISKEIDDSFKLMKISRKNVWRYLYIPSVFPSLVTGWITAAGGAWNASIVAEYLSFQGKTIQTLGLGSLISESATQADFKTLVACLTVMVITVIILNRIFWSPIYKISQTRFRLDF